MSTTIIQTALNDLEELVTEVKDELGILGHAMAANLKYDAEKFWTAAKAAGTVAENDVIALTKAHIGDFWITVKDQASAIWNQVKTLGFEAAVAAIKDKLKAVNWQSVGAGLVGIAESTLLTAARDAATMLISGLLAIA